MWSKSCCGEGFRESFARAWCLKRVSITQSVVIQNRDDEPPRIDPAGLFWNGSVLDWLSVGRCLKRAPHNPSPICSLWSSPVSST